MRVSREQAAANRDRILQAAARLIRERGIAAVGVDALAQAAGMTHGSVYSQFGSKDRLVAEALRHAMASSTERTAGRQDLGSFVEGYLSPRHRDAPGKGCAIAALGGEIGQQSDAARASFTEGLRGMIDRLAALQPEAAGDQRQAALAAAATLVGALMLSRAVDDPGLSDEILAAGRQALAPRRQ